MTSQLFKIISSPFFGLDARKLVCISQFVLALLESKSVNLKRLSLNCCFKSNNIEARYRRLQRLICNLSLTQAMLARWISSYFEVPLSLAMDRTNWKFGSFEINILTLGILFKGFCIPVFWKLIPHKGCSCFEDRKELIDQAVQLFTLEKLESLVADREFVGKEWFNYLKDLGIEYHVRLKNNVKISRLNGELKHPCGVFKSLKNNEKIHLPGPRKITNQKDKAYYGYVSACRSSEGESVIILSSKNPEVSLDKYKKRWGIECLFSALKTRGFGFEETHLNKPERISNLLILLAIAFFFSIIVGNWLNEVAPIKFKTHKRKAVSLFRYGLDALCIVQKEFYNEIITPLCNKIPRKPSKELLKSIGYL
jgi:hypothetical protein